MADPYHRELQQVGSGIGKRKEWASEGESKTSVDETERRLRYQIRHMLVCSERAYITPSRVAPQEMILLSQHWTGMGVFFMRRAAQ